MNTRCTFYRCSISHLLLFAVKYYFDVVRSTPEEYFFTLADVSGKGVKAGMYMAKASSIFRTLTNLKFPLEKVVFGVNNELVEAKFKGMFVTAVFGKLNIKTGELVFINAGHESILTFDAGKNYEYIKSDMPPIGIVKYFTESMVKSNTINLCLLYTSPSPRDS